MNVEQSRRRCPKGTFYSRSIPYEELHHYTHTRIPLPKPSWSELLSLSRKGGKGQLLADSIITRLFRMLKLHKANNRWIFFRVLNGIFHLYFKIFHSLRVYGEENIPQKGGIYIVNHVNEIDVVGAFLGAIKRPVGVFTDIGGGILPYMLEYLGFVPRLGTSAEMVEKMIRSILCLNPHFAIWPEGTPERKDKIMQGFSGIIKVYATINSEQNIIPFVPVVMQISYKRKNIKIPKWIRKNPKRIRSWIHFSSIFRPLSRVSLTFLRPIYLPREWLKTPDQGGKTPREMIDYLMLIIAKKCGQDHLEKNPVLERRKKTYNIPWNK